MHLVPAERADRKTIDDHVACDAIAALPAPERLRHWTERFTLLADPGRLSLLLCIRAAPGICVTDLAIATGINDAAVSQALRLLRTAGLVKAAKDGQRARYRLSDNTAELLLSHIAPGDQPAALSP